VFVESFKSRTFGSSGRLWHSRC